MKSNYHFKFEELLIYQKSMLFGESVYKQVKTFPKDERYELSSQFKRASDSIALNIAEGSGGTDKQFYNYLGNAWHSAHECVSCSSKAYLRNLINDETNENNRKDLTEITKMISALRAIILKRITN
jgi:four helix bundle protein